MAYNETINNLYGMTPTELAQHLWASEHGNHNYNTNDSEYRSWTKSLPLLIKDIYEAGLTNLSLIMEYATPLDSRIDAILVGKNHERQPQILIVENKQWSDEKIKPDDNISTVKVEIEKNQFESRTHPLQQLVTYSKHLEHNHSYFKTHNVNINVAAYVHNLVNTNLLCKGKYQVWSNCGMNKFLFGENEHQTFRRYLKRIFDNEPDPSLVKGIIKGQYTLGNADFNGLYNAVHNKENATMIADQIGINSYIIKKIHDQLQNPHKELLIISGAAGTGKTILGIHAIYDYYHMVGEQNNKAVYSLPRSKTVKAYILGVTGISVPYDNGIPSDTDLIVIDEAHRMTNINQELGTLFNHENAHLIIVLQDDHQLIQPNEEGTVNNFEAFAEQDHIPVSHRSLNIEKRNGFQSNLVSALDSLFDNSGNALYLHKSIPLYIYNKLSDMEPEIQMLNHNHITKWVAPFCWKWNGTNHDITINDNGYMFQHPWNPGSSYKQSRWLLSKSTAALNKVACIYTTQGLEFDYVGFIWWDDLRWDNHSHKWIADLSKCQDNHFKQRLREYCHGIPKQKDILPLFFDIYKVLLTRAKYGMAIWFKDSATKEHVKNFLNIKCI